MKSVDSLFLTPAPLSRTTLGVRNAQEKLKEALYNQGLHFAERKRFDQEGPQSNAWRLNLGCGGKIKDGWCNVDMSGSLADYRFDLREPWPFAEESASVVYSEHFFEHLEYPGETSHYLREALRVLRAGGILHIGVPGTAWLMRSYENLQSEYWRIAKSTWHPPTCQTRMHHINHHFRQDGQHRYAWDHETLLHEILAMGFPCAAKRRWSAKLDSEDRRVNSIYVMARK